MKQDFPLLQNMTTYLDSASTTQKPSVVINTVQRFYAEHNANIHRGIYPLSIRATTLYEKARTTVAEFIGSNADELIFTSGTTDALNLLATVLPSLFGNRKEIVLTELEHHANLIPWQELAKAKGYELKLARIDERGELDYAHAESLIGDDTALVSFTHVSNALGTKIDAKRLVHMARMKGALTVIDAAQSVAHERIDVKDIDCDFLVFSGHKVYGPMGIGVLYGKKRHLNNMKPHRFGGDMIREVTFTGATYLDAPQKFEAGTPNVAGAIGLGAALEYVQDRREQTRHRMKEVYAHLAKTLAHNPRIKLFVPPSAKHILSFTVEGIHPHDVAQILAQRGICIRAGHHCAQPLMTKLGVAGLCRISLGMYNTKEDIDKLADALQTVLETFA